MQFESVEVEMNMIGNSPAFREMNRLIGKIANCDAPVLIEGETGTGKELAARAIHYLGSRNGLPFIPVNCGAIPDSLIENELFGHHKGAFTDAKESQCGLIAQAQGGTLFLDEVDALSAKGQVTLLRFLQDQQYRPLGGKQQHSADVRIIAATNASLPTLIGDGAFRPDLLFRLKILSLELPPLRERHGDAELLAKHYLGLYSKKYGMPEKTLHPEALAWVNRYAWPGNVRELENMIHREFLLAEGPVICIACEGSQVERRKRPDRRNHELFDADFNSAKAKVLTDFERQFLAMVLSKTKGNVSQAAKMVGKERRAFGKLLKKHGIDKNEYLSS